jgi:phospholipid/cholesterol/gamma-HCH transport system substrate-binding protein
MKKPNTAAIGAFVLGAVALALVGAIALGSGTLLHHTQRFLLFFDGSVNGLTVGSPVKLRGVEIGHVVEVNALSDASRKDILNEVVVEVDPARLKRVGPGVDVVERAQSLVENGMRGRLELQSLVTGQLYVGFDFYPSAPVRLLGLDSAYPELPTIPSVSEEVADTARAFIARLQQLPLEDIAKNLDAALSGVAQITRSPDLVAAIAELDETVAEIRHAARGAGKLIGDTDDRILPVADSAVKALDQARATLANLDSAVQPGSDERYQLTLALEEVAEAARSISALADTVQRNPSSLVFGRTREASR